jgi:hypothetical protein
MRDLLKDRVFATFGEIADGSVYRAEPGPHCPKALEALSLELLSDQERTWSELYEGYEGLNRVRERTLTCSGFSVRLQYNPKRMKSSTAQPLTPASRGDNCFLCLEHLPEEQKAILYRGKYLILCNPMPVFSRHFTISHVDHQPQNIRDHIGTLLHLMDDFGSGWMVLYNGPRCGASAPAHRHFQVVPSGRMPVETEIRDERRLQLLTRAEDVRIYRVKGLGREIILMDGENPVGLDSPFRALLEALKTALSTQEEPMLNIAGSRNGETWRLLIFPRRKHRPDDFFKEGDARVLVSPGVIDMGGVLITPVEKDFNALDSDGVERIYREVSLDDDLTDRALALI